MALTIILVEDSEDDAFFFQRTLEKTGINCDCVHVSTGEAAISYLKQRHDRSYLVFLDLRLPGVNGFAVMEWLQTQRFEHHIEVVILSGSGDPCDVTSAEKHGVTDYLIKPISETDLAKRIQTQMEKDQAARSSALLWLNSRGQNPRLCQGIF
jgi:CheY-like chemotaxis protein